MLKKQIKSGFTIVELMVVLVLIAILFTVVVVAYNGIQARAIDTAVAYDASNMNSAQQLYKATHGGTAKAYYSGNGIDSSLEFKPSNENVVDVVVDGKDYCIRTYNTNGTNNSIESALITESSSGVCDLLAASDQAIADSASPVWTQMSVGYSHTCGVNSQNNIFCWGLNSFQGLLGDGTSVESSYSPVAVYDEGNLSGKTIKKVSPGYEHTCVLASDEKVYCWGSNMSGELGNREWSDSNVPVPLYMEGALVDKTIKSMSGGTCVIASDNLAYCWGSNGLGRLGVDWNVYSEVREPITVDRSGLLSGKTMKMIATGGGHTCAVASDNKLYCWGYNASGQLGNGTTTGTWQAVEVDMDGVLSGKTIKSLVAGNTHTCVIASDNLAYCWGSNYYGRLGNGSDVDSYVPVPVSMPGTLTGKTVKMISAHHGSGATCMISSEDKAYCWGHNYYGQLGDGTNTYSFVPVPVYTEGALSGKTVKLIYASQNYVCAVASDDGYYCWGENTHGQLGNGNTNNSNVPVQVISF